MLQWLKGRRTAPPAPGPAPDAGLSEPLHAHVVWREGASPPIPDWDRQPWPETADDAALHRHANGLAAAWLDATATAQAVPHRRAESDHFMLLSPWERKPAHVLLDYLERSRRRVLAALPGVADDQGHGKTAVMVFADEDAYYRYIANYGSQSDAPEAFSSGMFIDAGYGHFVFVQGPFDSMEPVVVHELTHCLVRHRPIPAWLNEGLAVNTEQRFTPNRSRYRPNELAYLFGQFWTPETIQEFWSGKSFLRPDDGQPLSYELARLLVHLLDKDYALLARFCEHAQRDDGGEAAAVQVLGAGVGSLAAVVLGEGDWAPRPALWTTGTEKGQFRA